MAPILLVTRPVETAQTFASKVANRYAKTFSTIFSPALEIVPLEPLLPQGYDHLILTSANGVRQAARLKVNVEGSVFCIGHRTTELAKAHSFSAIRAGNCAKELIESISNQTIDGSFLHLAGAHTRGEIVEKLSKSGLKASRVIAYDQRKLPPTFEAEEALKGTLPIVLPLFSPRSAGLLAQCKVRAPIHVVAMSEGVKSVLPRTLGWSMEVVNVPDEDHIVEATIEVLNRLTEQ